MMKKAVFIAVALVLLSAAGYFYPAVYAEPSQLKAIKTVEDAQAREQDLIARPRVEYEAGSLRDPFTGVMARESISTDTSVVEAAPPDLTVQGIIWGGRFPQAIINNKVLGVGDSIKEARITSIGKEGVTLLYGGKSFTLNSPMAGSADNN
ncbi:MAG: hypothetical protein NT060_03535 [Candidatus Omnitrophica bacterium]|nr:hypothetical protein [Candidatus Omnitrophota bacterium]